MTPTVLVTLVLSLYPLVYLVLLSVSDSTLGQPFREWTFGENFETLVHDRVFRDSIARSIVFALAVTAVELALGVALALLLRSFLRGGSILRALILLPLMTPPIMVAVVWKLILAPAGGLLNAILEGTGLTSSPVAPLGSSAWALPMIGLTDVWQWTPFVAILAFAALQALPDDVEEAAAVDGASRWATFRRVTLPLLLPALIGITLIKLIISFKLFDLVYLLTFGGPGNDTTVATFDIYRTALQEFEIGYAAAQTIVFAVLVGVVTVPFALAARRMHW